MSYTCVRRDKGGTHRHYWTPERVIDAYHVWMETHGRYPRQRDLYYDRALPCYTTIYKRFGGIALVPQKG